MGKVFARRVLQQKSGHSPVTCRFSIRVRQSYCCLLYLRDGTNVVSEVKNGSISSEKATDQGHVAGDAKGQREKTQGRKVGGNCVAEQRLTRTAQAGQLSQGAQIFPSYFMVKL